LEEAKVANSSAAQRIPATLIPGDGIGPPSRRNADGRA
jgi:hypothetical protein